MSKPLLLILEICGYWRFGTAAQQKATDLLYIHSPSISNSPQIFSAHRISRVEALAGCLTIRSFEVLVARLICTRWRSSKPCCKVHPADWRSKKSFLSHTFLIWKSCSRRQGSLSEAICQDSNQPVQLALLIACRQGSSVSEAATCVAPNLDE